MIKIKRRSALRLLLVVSVASLISAWMLPQSTGSSRHDTPPWCRLRVSILRRMMAGEADLAPPTESVVSTSSKYIGTANVTLRFPSFIDLMNVEPGSCVLSDSFEVKTSYGLPVGFRVKLYPRGGGTDKPLSNFFKGKNKSGFGMSYRILPRNSQEKVSVYLQYVPDDQSRDKFPNGVDATFALRLLGRQQAGHRFDVEWRAGMRLVPLDDTKLAEGQSNDFGAGLMQTPLLASFLGVTCQDDSEEGLAKSEENSRELVQLQVSIELHGPPTFASSKEKLGEEHKLSLLPDDLRGANPQLHDPKTVRVGRIVVPVLTRLDDRPRMFQAGVYPGVEYRILRIIDAQSESDCFFSRSGVDYELTPIYPLVQQLERNWPVRVNEADIPKLLSPNMYNAVSAAGSLLTAAVGLCTAFVLSQAISIFVIPSQSMEPTLDVGDVLLVEKVTPRLFPASTRTGQVILFEPPEKLRQIVGESGRTLGHRDLFVKRVAAKPGSSIEVKNDGSVLIDGEPPRERRDLCAEEPLRLISKYVKPTTTQVVPKGSVVVLGDCGSVSIDSRVWGPLPVKNIVGKPLGRVWPPSRMGSIHPLLTTEWKD